MRLGSAGAARLGSAALVLPISPPTPLLGKLLLTWKDMQVVTSNNIKDTGIHDCLNGENGRKQVDHWVPNWLQFPYQSHTETPINNTRIGNEWERIAGLI